MRWPDLSDIFEGLPWAVVGAAATRLYMPERATHDLDVVIRAKDREAARERLRRAGYSYVGELAIGGSSWTAPDQTPVDVIEGHEPWWPEALARAADNRDGQGLPVLPLAYLVLTKVQAGRGQDIGDVMRMLGQADDSDLLAVRQLISHIQPDLREDLESLISLGKLESGEASQ